MNKKIALIISVSGAIMFSMALLYNKGIQTKSFVSALGCNHVGNHYAAVEPTETTPGNREFWVCCKCHEVYLEKPAIGEFKDQPASAMVGGLDETHIAYLSPLQGGGSGDYYIVDPFDE